MRRGSTKGLRPLLKTQATTLRTSGPLAGTPLRRETWYAETQDGEWGFERLDDTGTPWAVIHWPHDEARRETITSWFGTLTSARQSAERGLEQWHPSYQAARHAEGDYSKCEPYGCRACSQRRTAEALRRFHL